MLVAWALVKFCKTSANMYISEKRHLNANDGLGFKENSQTQQHLSKITVCFIFYLLDFIHK